MIDYDSRAAESNRACAAGVLDTPADPGRITSASRTRDFAMFFPPLLKQFRSARLENR